MLLRLQSERIRGRQQNEVVVLNNEEARKYETKTVPIRLFQKFGAFLRGRLLTVWTQVRSCRRTDRKFSESGLTQVFSLCHNLVFL